jgi:hypothetical protein
MLSNQSKDDRFIADTKIIRHDSRDKNSFNHACEVIKPWGGLEPMLEWCKKECQGEWRWQMIDMSTDIRPGRYIYYFDEEKDYVAFLLKWKI